MTIIFDMGEFWIEAIQIDSVTPAAIGTVTENFLLTKSGRFVGAGLGYGFISGNGNEQYGALSIHQAGPSAIDYGDAVGTTSSLALRFFQADATSRTVKIYALIFMRK